MTDIVVGEYSRAFHKIWITYKQVTNEIWNKKDVKLNLSGTTPIQRTVSLYNLREDMNEIQLHISKKFLTHNL
jgi:hypothetical protein